MQYAAAQREVVFFFQVFIFLGIQMNTCGIKKKIDNEPRDNKTWLPWRMKTFKYFKYFEMTLLVVEI